MVSAIIAKTNGKDKVVDFRDYLNLANPDDYAMMHGVGGKKHAQVSVIKVVICDYTAGTGENSKTVSANISPATVTKLLEVCKRNIGTIVIPNDLAPLVEQRGHNADMKKIANMHFGILRRIIKLCTSIQAAAQERKMPGLEVIAGTLASMLDKEKSAVLEPTQIQTGGFFSYPAHCDINHVQDRVHATKQGPDGYAPVQRLTITHQAYRQDGSLSRYPWYINITNGEALVRVSDIGATSFDPKTLRNTEEAFINVSEEDMFRCLDRVEKYIDVWEKLHCIPLAKEGLRRRQAEIEAYRNNQQEGL